MPALLYGMEVQKKLQKAEIQHAEKLQGKTQGRSSSNNDRIRLEKNNKVQTKKIEFRIKFKKW